MELAAWEILLVGLIIVVAILSKAALERVDLPDLLGYLLLGVGLRALDVHWNVVLASGHQLLTFLAEIGVEALLFRIGLECEFESMRRRLPGAAPIWLVNITASLTAVFAVAYGRSFRNRGNPRRPSPRDPTRTRRPRDFPRRPGAPVSGSAQPFRS